MGVVVSNMSVVEDSGYLFSHFGLVAWSRSENERRH